MIDTSEYYGGTYPDPPEFEEKEENDDYEWQYADERYELEKLEMI